MEKLHQIKNNISVSDLFANELSAEAKQYRSADDFVKAKAKFYHWTIHDFKEFSIKEAWKFTEWDNARFGFFFIKDKKMANDFVADNKPLWDIRSVKVKEATLKINNPLDLTISWIFTKTEQAPLIVKMLWGWNMKPKEASEFLDENIWLWEVAEMYETIYSNLHNKKLMQSHWFDGIISQFWKDAKWNVIKEYVAFSSEQIKTKEQLIDIWNDANK